MKVILAAVVLGLSPVPHHTHYIQKHHQKAKVQVVCNDLHPKVCIWEASKRYHVNYSWLLACATSESGLIHDQPNKGGSGAFGLFQFMKSTYRRTLQRMGAKWHRFDSAKWQARAAAWKFKHDGSGEWTGSGC